MTESQFTSPTLLENLRVRDQQGWSKFIRIYTPLIYQWARKAGLQHEDITDVAQEVLRVVYLKIDRFDESRKQKGAFRSWLFGVTRIAILDHKRVSSKQEAGTGGTDAHFAMQQIELQQLDEIEHEADFVMGVDRVVLQQVIKLIQSEYNDSTWQAFWQTAVAGRKASEVAVEFGMNSAAVRQSKYRVLKRLREELIEFE